MKVKAWTVAISVAAVGVSAQAQTQEQSWYGELGYTAMALKNDYSGGTETVTPNLGRLVLGKEVSDHFAIEGIAGMTLSKGTIDNAKVSADVTGLYLKAFTSVSTETSVFARLGYANNSGKSEVSGKDYSWSSSNASYGVGLQTQFTKNVYGALDYMDYGKKTLSAADGGGTIKHSGFTVSIGTRF